MTSRDAVLRLLADHPVGLTDGDLAGMLRRRLTTIDRMCCDLAAENLIVRDTGEGLIVNRLGKIDPVLPSAAPDRLPAPVTARAVQREVVKHVTDAGGMLIDPVANPMTASTQDGDVLRITVIGRVVAERARAHFADAIMTGLHLRAEHPDDDTVVAFPLGPRYQALADEVVTALEPAGVHLWCVDETGTVTPHIDLASAS
jgi:hypothetical protein